MRPTKYPYSKSKLKQLPFGYQKAFQSVVNAKDGLFIDGKRIDFILEESVFVDDIGNGMHEVTFSLLTDDYRTK